jgi:hypothetical protein
MTLNWRKPKPLPAPAVYVDGEHRPAIYEEPMKAKGVWYVLLHGKS